MDRVNQIWNHPLYQNELNKLQLLETDREFCRHTPEHFLDVARLAISGHLRKMLLFQRN